MDANSLPNATCSTLLLISLASPIPTDSVKRTGPWTREVWEEREHLRVDSSQLKSKNCRPKTLTYSPEWEYRSVGALAECKGLHERHGTDGMRTDDQVEQIVAVILRRPQVGQPCQSRGVS